MSLAKAKQFASSLRALHTILKVLASMAREESYIMNIIKEWVSMCITRE
jgi:hypothetical protein